MIIVLSGDNSFEIARALDELRAGFEGQTELIDGSELELRDLPDLLMGATLFASERQVIIKHLSDNKTLWSAFGDWLERISDDVQLIIVEQKPDKRTRTYKELQKIADMRDFKTWGERDTRSAEGWVVHEAARLGSSIDKTSAAALVARAGVDQWALADGLSKLTLLSTITPDTITELVDASPTENVFNLFETALRRDSQQLQIMLRTLQLTQDPYQLFGLLGGQVFQLAALVVSNESPASLAKTLGVHPFALSKLVPYADRYTQSSVAAAVVVFADADQAMKNSTAEPWLLIERALLKISYLSN